MKKTITLLSFVILCSSAAIAQRHIDLKLTMVSPGDNLSFEQGSPFALKAVVENLGPDVFQVSDSFKLQMFLDNFPLSIGNGSSVDSFIRVGQKLLAPGDTAQVNMPMYVMFSGHHSFCLAVTLVNNAASAVVDTGSANDKQCAFLNIFPTSVSSAYLENEVKIYPVPAKDVINWETSDVFIPSQIILYDFMGRVAYRNAANGKSGQVNVGGFAKGVYQLQMTGAENKIVSKRVVLE